MKLGRGRWGFSPVARDTPANNWGKEEQPRSEKTVQEVSSGDIAVPITYLAVAIGRGQEKSSRRGGGQVLGWACVEAHICKTRRCWKMGVFPTFTNREL